MKWLWGWVLAFLAATPAWAELAPGEVAIVAMADSQESRDLAEYYAKARGIPLSHICLLQGKPGRTIPRTAWQEKVRPAILDWLKEKGLSTKIRCLVTS